MVESIESGGVETGKTAKVATKFKESKFSEKWWGPDSTSQSKYVIVICIPIRIWQCAMNLYSVSTFASIPWVEAAYLRV